MSQCTSTLGWAIAAAMSCASAVDAQDLPPPDAPTADERARWGAAGLTAGAALVGTSTMVCVGCGALSLAFGAPFYGVPLVVAGLLGPPVLSGLGAAGALKVVQAEVDPWPITAVVGIAVATELAVVAAWSFMFFGVPALMAATDPDWGGFAPPVFFTVAAVLILSPALAGPVGAGAAMYALYPGPELMDGGSTWGQPRGNSEWMRVPPALQTMRY
jgi:hypothetical protein